MADVMNEVLLLDMLNINYNFSHIFIELKQFIHAGNRPSQTLIQKLSTKLNTYGICRYNNFYERATNQRIDIDIMELISIYSVMLDTNILKIMMSLDNKNVDIIMEKYENKICYDLIKIFDNNTSGYTRYILNKYKNFIFKTKKKQLYYKKLEELCVIVSLPNYFKENMTDGEHGTSIMFF